MFNKYNFIIHKICSKQRAEISGVFVSPKETVATDGIKMIRIDSKANDRNFNAFIMSKEDAITASKNNNDFKINPDLFVPIKEKYPEYNGLMVESGKYTTIKLNPKYLQEMAEFFNKFNGTEVILKVPFDNKGIVRFHSEKDGQKADGLLMPMA